MTPEQEGTQQQFIEMVELCEIIASQLESLSAPQTVTSMARDLVAEGRSMTHRLFAMPLDDFLDFQNRLEQMLMLAEIVVAPEALAALLLFTRPDSMEDTPE